MKWTPLTNGRFGAFDPESVPRGWPSSLATILFEADTVNEVMAWIYRDRPSVAAVYAKAATP